jgi:hypothetical protein
MAPLQRSARRARPRHPRAYLTARDDLESRIVPALIGPTATAPTVLVPPGSHPIEPDGGSGSPSGYTPQQIRTAYGINEIRFGSITGDGAGQTIAIVDAYDDPGLVDSSASNFSTSDLAEFDQAFDLPDPPSFTKLNQYGGTTGLPGTDPAGAGSSSGNWEYEEAMDVEWAHVIAPAANIVLVESNSNSFSDLYSAISIASNLPGVSVVSLSWGSSEFSGESFSDSYFETPTGHQGETFVAASGDGGSPGIYPASSPNVVAAGGTTLTLGSNGSYESETAWSGSGGGVSSYESEPAYQDGVQSTGYRTTPDVAFVADRSTGVPVYDSYDNTGGGPWNEMGGTSLAAPSWAALIAIADQGRVALGGTTLDGVTQTLPALYALPSTDFHDITTGSNGGYNAGPGYDEVTGLGTPVANLLVPDLASYGMPDQLVVTTQPPGSISAGSPFGLTVAVESPGGQVITGATGTVTLSLANDPGGAALDGTLTVTLNQGVATFSGLSIDQAGTGYSLLVSGTSLDSATSGPFNVVPAAASQLVISTQPAASLTAGGAFGLAVSVEDPFGNLETDYSGSVTLALGANPAGGGLGGDLTIPASGGVAVFSGLTLDQAGNGYTIQATASGLSTAATPSFNVTPATPAQLVVTTQPASTITAGAGFGLAVSIEDAYGNIETTDGGTVSVAVSDGPAGARLGGTVSLSAVNGVATFSRLALNRAGSGYTLQASSAGLTSATTTAFTVNPAAPEQLIITAQPPASVTAGAGFGLTVSVEDVYGNLETSYGGHVVVNLTGGPGGASLIGTLTLPASGGVADFSALTLDLAGTGYTIHAVGTGLAGATTSSFGVIPAAPAQIEITAGPPSSVMAGDEFGLSASLEDAYGNLETTDNSSVSIALTGGPSGASLGGTTAVSATGGVASFSGLTLDQSGSGYAIQVTSDGLTTATTTAFTVNPAAPAQLIVTAQPPASLTASDDFGLTVSAEDSYGNLEPDFNGNVSVALSSGPSGASLGGTLTIPAIGGVADFSGLTLTEADSGYALQTATAGLTGAATNPISVNPAAPAQLVITAQPATSVTAGQSFGVTVAVEDAFGNAEPSYDGDLTLALAGGTAGTRLGGDLTTAADKGIASFSSLSLDRADSGYTIQASGDDLTGASTTAFQVTPAAASRLVIVAQPPLSLTAGQPFGFTVAAEDPFGNVVTGFDGSVSTAMAQDPGGTPLSGVLTVTADNGLARFSGLTIDRTGAGYTAIAASSNLSTTTTASINVSSAVATRLVITVQPPASATAGSGFGLVVTAEDPFGNVDTSFQGVVTATLSPSLDAGVLGGTTSVSAVNGVAQFSGLTLTRAIAGDSLQLASGRLSPVATNPFTVNPAAPTQVVLISQPPGKIPAHQSFSFTAAVEDTFGNIVTDYNGGVSVALAAGPGHARFHGSLTVQASAGVAVFNGSMSKKRGKGNTALSVSALGLTPATSNVFKVAHPNPAASVFATRLHHGRVRTHALRPASRRSH